MNLCRDKRTLAKGTRIGVAEPHTGEAPVLTKDMLLAVQEELETEAKRVDQALPRQAGPTAEATPDPSLEAAEKPEVNWESIPDHLKDKVRALLDEFAGLWSGKLGELKATTHRIQLQPDARPVYSASYRAGPHRLEEIEKQVKKMLDMGVIEPSDAEWSFPVVVAPKPCGHFRLCVDYRRLNEMSVKDIYPLPRMDDYLDSLGDATVFSTFDCNASYWQIPVAEEDRDKTTFTAHTGLLRFLRLPFGLVNAPASFQRALDIILSELRWKTCLFYLDDVIVFSRTAEDHIKHLREVLLLLEKAGVTCKPVKCNFFQREVEYLGHIVRPGQLLVNHKKIKSLARALPPRNQTELKSFLSMCNVHRRFIKDYAHIAKPLTKLTSNKLPHVLPELTPEQLQAFQYLKDRLTSTPILALPHREGRFSLDTDFCCGTSWMHPTPAAARQQHSPVRVLQPERDPGREKLFNDRPRMPGGSLGVLPSPALPGGRRVHHPDGPRDSTLVTTHGQRPGSGGSLAVTDCRVPVQGVHETREGAPLCRHHVTTAHRGAGRAGHPGGHTLFDRGGLLPGMDRPELRGPRPGPANPFVQDAEGPTGR